MSKILDAFKILDDANAEHSPIMAYGGYSGGNDSLCTLDVLSRWAHSRNVRFRALHINTGIGIEKTREHVRRASKEQGWNLLEIRAKEDCGQDYEELVLEHGFPGPDHHTKMYNRLKERGIRLAMKRAKRGHSRTARVMMVTGIRAEESSIRAGYKRTTHRIGSMVWVNPLYRWTGSDCHDYIERHDLPVNPVSKVLGMSGECLCGAYAHKGELDLVRIADPDTADYIEDLERRVKAAGKPWGWEDPGPPKRWLLEREGQQTMFQPLCAGCGKTDAKTSEAVA